MIWANVRVWHARAPPILSRRVCAYAGFGKPLGENPATPKE
jgi:hypothetical protein